MSTIDLKCQCGTVQGSLTGVSPRGGNRVICCCSDCQAFADYLGRSEEVLDEFGGTDIYQIAPCHLSIHSGQEQLRSMRLTKKGLLRWYTGCCNTPVGNTVSAKMPFVGVIHNFIDVADSDKQLGSVQAVVQTQHCKVTPGYAKHSAGFPKGVTIRIMLKLLLWKVQGKSQPNVFFAADGRPIVKPAIVTET